jgi:ribonuclease T2
MRPPPNLSWPAIAVVAVVALAIVYLQDGEVRREEPLPSPTASERQYGEPHKAGTAGRARNNEAGNFDYYSLVLSWSPTHCDSPEGQDDETQCAPRGGRRYAFILHGLWPQYERGYPEECPTRTRPYVSQNVIDDMFDIMPSKRLIIHEYRKHGTCSGLTPEGYYQTARRMFESVTIPQRFRDPPAEQYMSPGEVVRAFVDANPGLRPDMFGVACRGPGTRFREVRICFTKTGSPRSCGPNEDQRQLCRSSRMHVPPVR